VGEDTYDKGAEILRTFFHECIREYLDDDLTPLGRDIITCCLDDGSLDDYEKLIPREGVRP
jgi:hypothetical protein